MGLSSAYSCFAQMSSVVIDWHWRMHVNKTTYSLLLVVPSEINYHAQSINVRLL